MFHKFRSLTMNVSVLPDLPMPHNTDDANKILSKHGDYAYHLKYEGHFSRAVNLLYRPYIVIKKNSIGRMNFECLVCSKEFSSTETLKKHVQSDIHLKKLLGTEPNQSSSSGQMKLKKYKTNSLQLMLPQAKIPVLGLQRVDCYDDGSGRLYYKCTLCSSHGKGDYMYRHLIGDTHTDKYLRSKLVLKNSLITSEERARLREFVYSKEMYDESYIKTCVGQEYYPYIWENGGIAVPSSRICRGSSRFDQLPTSRTDDVKNLSVASVLGACAGTPGVDKAIQVYSPGFYKQLFLRFSFIIATHHLEKTRIITPEDFKRAFTVLSFVLHWLYFTTEAYLQEERDYNQRQFHQGQIKVLTTCMGYLVDHFGEIYKLKHGDHGVEFKNAAKH